MKQATYGKVYTAASICDVIKVNYVSLQAFGTVQWRTAFFWDVLNTGCLMPDILRPHSGLFNSRMSSEDTWHLTVEDDATAWVRNGEQQISRDGPKYRRRNKISTVTSRLATYVPNYVKNKVTGIRVYLSTECLQNRQ